MLPNFSVPDRVEQMGFRARQCAVSRADNPYTDLADPVLAPSSAAAARMLEAAWWQGWDRAASGSSRAKRDRDRDRKTAGVKTDQLANAFTVYPSNSGSVAEAARRLHHVDER